MTKEEAIAYCHAHHKEYVDSFDASERPQRMFDCLVSCLESGHILPDQLEEYGMDFNDEIVLGGTNQ